jgi:hypothetical protein
VIRGRRSERRVMLSLCLLIIQVQKSSGLAQKALPPVNPLELEN